MKTKEVLRKLEGMHTIESVMDILKTDKKRAVYYVYRLRKQGYVKTQKTHSHKRVYSISFENKLGGKSYYDVLNEYSPVHLAEPNIHKFHGKGPAIEETIIFAVKSGDNRVVKAALYLFSKIKNWKRMYELAKKEKIEREITALYMLARKIMHTRRIDKRLLKNILNKKQEGYKYIIKHEKSDDFQDIENKWKVYIPFNKADLEAYA